MRNKFLALTLILGLAICTKAQQTTKVEKKPEPTFTADSLTFEKGSNVLVYMGDVNVKDKIFEIKKADKIFYDSQTQKITAFGFSEFKIVGSIIILNPEQKSTSIEYTLGQTVAYIK